VVQITGSKTFGKFVSIKLHGDGLAL